ncbi:MAG TPA: hypothetical protein PL093_01780 [Candidatus Pacearchaeota archaeon]|nr:hypothetical protein [Candidatus Pacearchaeota archaeon]HRR94868.1 hypothetical protein [Candidatus Paceibacterota bacterium]HPC30755.1 hypothetical protein [Candidatus Pacearchaeota archaeon]HQG09444.1 hypothetical protein [Candidatus Pacearchaeota archaeon]HQH20289.1 hypothetical protein [Candidatus Pacearchaeota archaeon]
MTNLTNAFTQYILNNAPNLLWGLFILFLGYLISLKIKKIAINLFNKIRLNQMAKSLGWETFLDRYDLDIAKVFGVLIEILFILLFLTVFFDIVGLEQADSILMAIINYYPNILISIVIFIFAIYIANFSKKIVLVSLEKQKITYSGILGDILAGATWILAVLSILYQLKIVPTLVLSIFIGIVALLVLSFGLAFGLGGKDLAKKLLEDWKNQIK